MKVIPSPTSPRFYPNSRLGARAAFSLAEMLISTAVLTLMMVMIFAVIDQVTRVWKSSTSAASTYSGAQAALDTIARRLSSATLNSYSDYMYLNNDASQTQVRYSLKSDLHFLCGPIENLLPDEVPTHGHATFFQAAAGYAPRRDGDEYDLRGLYNLLNVCGYYLEYASDEDTRPEFFGDVSALSEPTYSYRLVEAVQPAQDFTVFNSTKRWNTLTAFADGTANNDPNTGHLNYDNTDIPWLMDGDTAIHAQISDPEADQDIRHTLAENVVLLLFNPLSQPLPTTHPDYATYPDGIPLTLSYGFFYDSFNATGHAFATNPWNPTTSNNPDIYARLPPLLEIILVAIDDASATKMSQRYTDPDNPPFGPEGIVDASTLFQDAANMEDDIETFKEALEKEGFEYRVFRKMIQLREAKQ